LEMVKWSGISKCFSGGGCFIAAWGKLVIGSEAILVGLQRLAKCCRQASMPLL
jgi:hypothetical protein